MGILWDKLARPVMFGLDAEHAHELGITALRFGLTSLAAPLAEHYAEFDNIELFGLKFPNPLGLAAGFDKNGLVVDQLTDLGFGFVEVGTVTCHPQPGNPKPRLFRLPGDQALINRLGFNNDGAVAVADRLGKLNRRCVVGVNIGRNKDVLNEAATENYLQSFDLVYDVADYITINISSPNTPNLRELQRSEHLEELLGALQSRNRELSSRSREDTQTLKPLLVKIAPDLLQTEIEAIVDTCVLYEIAGVIATNTTVSREGLKTADVNEIGAGGLSGKPLRDRSTEVISMIYRYSRGRLPIIGVGGIFTGQDAFDKIAAGASLVQAYTGFVYGGPSFARDVCNGLARILKEKGFSRLVDAVGSANPRN